METTQRTRAGWAVALLLAVAVIAGLLGMHVLSPPGGHDAHGATTVAAPTHHAADPAIEDAVGTPMGADAAAVLCLLALLALVALGARRVARLRVRMPVRRRAASRRPAGVIGAPAPDLALLCISRT